MNLTFLNGPLDGLKFASPLVPPMSFHLPTKEPLTVSTYTFTNVKNGAELVYEFSGYTRVSEEEAALLVESR